MAFPSLSFLKKRKPLILEIGPETSAKFAKVVKEDCVSVLIIYEAGVRDKGASDFFEGLAKKFQQQVSFFSTDTSNAIASMVSELAYEKKFPMAVIFRGGKRIQPLLITAGMESEDTYLICLENSLSPVTELEMDNLRQFRDILQEDKFVAVLFYKMDCPACASANRVMNALAGKCTGGISFYRHRTSGSGKVADLFGIKWTPTLTIFQGGSKPRAICYSVSFKGKDAYVKMIKDSLGKIPANFTLREIKLEGLPVLVPSELSGSF